MMLGNLYKRYRICQYLSKCCDFRELRLHTKDGIDVVITAPTDCKVKVKYSGVIVIMMQRNSFGSLRCVYYQHGVWVDVLYDYIMYPQNSSKL